MISLKEKKKYNPEEEKKYSLEEEKKYNLEEEKKHNHDGELHKKWNSKSKPEMTQK